MTDETSGSHLEHPSKILATRTSTKSGQERFFLASFLKVKELSMRSLLLLPILCSSWSISAADLKLTEQVQYPLLFLAQINGFYISSFNFASSAARLVYKEPTDLPRSQCCSSRCTRSSVPSISTCTYNLKNIYSIDKILIFVFQKWKFKLSYFACQISSLPEVRISRNNFRCIACGWSHFNLPMILFDYIVMFCSRSNWTWWAVYGRRSCRDRK